jgi:predicted ATPase/DNA-binding XRE family transcriptional regulator
METYFSLAWLRQRRKLLGLTYKEIALQVGCAVVTLKKIESGERRPSLQIAEKLADCLQIEDEVRSAFLADIRGLKAGAIIPHSEPLQFRVPFIGREAELRQLKKMLVDPGVRLVTILGPGGMGKTRLAQAALQSFLEDDPVHFVNGIYFVDLSGLASVDFLVNAIAQTLGCVLDTSGGRTPPALLQLAYFIGSKRQLLILDNFERVFDWIELVENLLRSTPKLRLLVTSREQLGLWEEHRFPLQGLDYPGEIGQDPQEMETYDAVKLFLAYCRRAQPDFELTLENQRHLARIFAMTDGNSLAIELTAAWVDTLSIKNIADELEGGLTLLHQRESDITHRHASLEQVFKTTFSRIGNNETRMFYRLSLFQGGFTRQAAESVAGAGIATLGSFIQKSMIHLNQRTGRYHIHELLRLFAHENLLSEAEYEPAGQALFNYFCNLIISSENRLHGAEQNVWLEVLDHEQDNIRFTLQWGIDHLEDHEGLVELVSALSWYWRMRSSVAEACTWLERINARVTPSPLLQARLYWVSGHHEWMRGAYSQARGYQQAGITLLDSRGFGLTKDMGKLKVSLGMAEAEDGKPEAANQAFEEALEIFLALKDDWWIAFTLGWLALPQFKLGNKPQARHSVSECIRLYRLLGDSWALGLNLIHFAEMEFAERNYNQAEELAKEALVIEDLTGHKHSVGQTLVLLGRISQKKTNYIQARAYFRQSLDIFQQMGHMVFAQQAWQYLNNLAEFIE